MDPVSESLDVPFVSGHRRVRGRDTSGIPQGRGWTVYGFPPLLFGMFYSTQDSQPPHPPGDSPVSLHGLITPSRCPTTLFPNDCLDPPLSTRPEDTHRRDPDDSGPLHFRDDLGGWTAGEV